MNAGTAAVDPLLLEVPSSAVRSQWKNIRTAKKRGDKSGQTVGVSASARLSFTTVSAAGIYIAFCISRFGGKLICGPGLPETSSELATLPHRLMAPMASAEALMSLE